MPTYICKARNWDGKVITTEVDAESEEAAIKKLRDKDYFVTSIKEKRAPFGLSLGFGRVSSKDVAVFAQMFSVMIGSGVPLVKCLTIMQQQMENPAFQRIIGQIRTDVEGGAPFSAALAKHPQVFDDLFVNLVKAGEAGGILDKILERLAVYLEKSEELKGKVKGAMAYPVVVMSIAFLVVLALVMFVLPQFKSIFQSMNVELPAMTLLLLRISDIMQEYWMLIIPGLLIIPVSIVQFFKTKQGKRVFDTNILRLPVIGMLMRKVAVARFTRTLGTMVSSGVPILQALEVTAATAGNVVIKEAVDRTRASIREGESIAEPLRASGVFPPMVVQMISVGEETGELDKMLLKIADFYDTEVDAAVKGLTSIIEPLVIVFMGLVIGGIVVSVFMPMLSLVNNIQ